MYFAYLLFEVITTIVYYYDVMATGYFSNFFSLLSSTLCSYYDNLLLLPPSTKYNKVCVYYLDTISVLTIDLSQCYHSNKIQPVNYQIYFLKKCSLSLCKNRDQ